MFSKIIVMFVSLFSHNNHEVQPVRRHIVVTVPEDEIVIVSINPRLETMYY